MRESRGRPGEQQPRGAALRRAQPCLAMVAVLLLCLSPGCQTTGTRGDEPTRRDLDTMAEQAVARLLAEQPGAQALLQNAVGWIVVDMRVAKIPLFGSGSGFAVVADRRSEDHAYLRVSRFELGGGLGAQHFKVVILVDDRQRLERAANGTWHYEASAQLGAGAKGSHSKTGPGYHAFWLTETGAVASVTVQVARATPFDPS